MHHFKEKSVMIALVVVAILAFYGGMEFKAYQIRSVMRDAFSGLQEGIGGSIEKSKEPTKNPPVNVQKGLSYTFNDAIKINIDSTKDIGNKYDKNYSTYNAVNNFYLVTLVGENIGKEPKFQSLSNIKLQLSDGKSYNSAESVQLPGEREGFGGCISCDMNPGEKSIEGVLFDLPKGVSLEGAKILIDSVIFDL